MNTDQLSNFIAIARYGSFSKAEKNLYVSKQALLKQINALEKELNFPLFNRKSNGITLTAEGQKFYDKLIPLYNDFERLIYECQCLSDNQEILRISEVEHQQLLNPVTNLFRKQYPNVILQTVIHPNHSGEFRVENNIMDVGETFMSEYFQKNIKCDYTPLTNYPYVIAMDKHHPLSDHKEVSLEECAQYPTNIFELMYDDAHLSQIKDAYKTHSENLILRNDIDNHSGVAYECFKTDKLFITFNPFIYSIKDLATRPLINHWSQEYGIIYPYEPNITIKKYIELAVAYYKHK